MPDTPHFFYCRVQPFDEWVTNCGVQRAPGVQLTSQDGLDHYVVASEGLAQGSPVLFVPDNMIFSTRAAKEEFGGAVQEAVMDLVVTFPGSVQPYTSTSRSAARTRRAMRMHRPAPATRRIQP